MIEGQSSGLIVSGFLGLITGSFLNVLISRYRQLETVVNTRSHCPYCKKIIRWYDLVPLFSFILLRANCRYCQRPISWQYPIIELLTALMAIHLYWLYGLSYQTLLYFVIFSLLLVAAAVDFIDRVVPDEFVLPAIILSFGMGVWQLEGLMTELVLGVGLVGGLLAVFVLFSRERWMGAGDITLGVALGLLGGWPGSLVGLVVAFGLGSMIGLLQIAAKNRSIKDAVAFGPYLVVGSYVAALYGDQLANGYFALVGWY